MKDSKEKSAYHGPYVSYKVSFFDLCDYSAGFYKCEMRGLYVMFTLISSCYILISALTKFSKSGYYLETDFLELMLKDFKLVGFLWPGVFLYSWLAYFLQVMILKGMPMVLANIYQHFSQTITFVIAIYLSLTRDWSFTQVLFVSLLSCVHFMKMHSYTLVNRDLRALKQKNSEHSPYPSNINAANFLRFMITPALVYQPVYPTYKEVRFDYIFKKLVLLMVQLTMIYIVVTDSILPVLHNSQDYTFTEILVHLTIPCLIFALMSFLVLFEQILNIFAELVKFADRSFYDDWWNSTTFEEFNRKWNRPVHLFLYKHVYNELIVHYGLSKRVAQMTTFLFSALLHEMIMALIIKQIKPVMLGFMMIQIPVIRYSRLFQKTVFGLYFYWFSIILGPPLILTIYAKSL